MTTLTLRQQSNYAVTVAPDSSPNPRRVFVSWTQTPDLMLVLDWTLQMSEDKPFANEAERLALVEDLITWATDHDPIALDSERERAWRKN